MAAGDFGAWLKNIHSIAIAAFDLALGKCEINPRVPKSAAAITCDSHFFNFDGLRWFRGCSSHISILIGFKQFIDREGCAMIPNVPRSAIKLAYMLIACITGIYSVWMLPHHPRQRVCPTLRLRLRT